MQSVTWPIRRIGPFGDMPTATVVRVISGSTIDKAIELIVVTFAEYSSLTEIDRDGDDAFENCQEYPRALSH